MSKESAEKFVNAYGIDSAIEEAVRALPEGEDSFEAIAGVGAHLGYDFTVEEFELAFAMRMKAEYEAAEEQNLSDEELGQVAGGKDKAECKDNYDGTRCWFNDSCNSAWHYYKQNPSCTATSNEYDTCWVVEDCGMIVIQTYR